VYLLEVTTYQLDEATNSSSYIDKISADPTQGRYYSHIIRNQTGSFYMYISTGYSDSYSIIVEQNVDSILATPTPAPTPTATAAPTTKPFTGLAIPTEVLYPVAMVAAIVAIAAGVVLVWRRTR
jgi:hypothetical protein